jgi:2-haloacid dehalogenase
LAARERVGGARWLHAARGFFHDIAPASALGIPTAWINRKGERAAAVPGLEVRTLAELAEVLCDRR